MDKGIAKAGYVCRSRRERTSKGKVLKTLLFSVLTYAKAALYVFVYLLPYEFAIIVLL